MARLGRMLKSCMNGAANALAHLARALLAGHSLPIKHEGGGLTWLRQDRAGKDGGLPRVWKLRTVGANAFRQGRGPSLTISYSPSRPGWAPSHSSPKGAGKTR